MTAIAVVAPGIATAHGGEAALFMFGDVVAFGLVALLCLLVRTSVLSRAIALAVALIACMVSYGFVVRTNPAGIGPFPMFLIGLLPPALLGGLALAWAARQDR